MRDVRDIVGRGMRFPVDVDTDTGTVAWSVPLVGPTDEDRKAAIESRIRHVVMTVAGERPLYREFGTELTLALFNLIQPAYVSAVLQRMIEAIERWEPRVQIIDAGATTADSWVKFTLSWRLSDSSLSGQSTIPIGFQFKETI